MDFIEILTILVMIVFGAGCLFGLLFVISRAYSFFAFQNSGFAEAEVSVKDYLLNSFNKLFDKKNNFILRYFRLSGIDNCYKELQFFLMQNNGGNPCEIEKAIEIRHSFTEEQLYI